MRCPAAVSILVLMGCMTQGAAPATRSAAIVGGASAVGGPSAIVGLSVGGGCTGTFIAPNLILTAKHCVVDTIGGWTCDEQGNVIVQMDGGVYSPNAGQFGAVHSPDQIAIAAYLGNPLAPHVAQVLVAPGGDVCKTDIALLILDRSVDDVVLAPIRLDAGPTLAEALTATGWGYTHDQQYASVLQRKQVSVLSIGPAAGANWDGGAAETLPVGFFSIGEGLCYGDSGSPAIAASGAVVAVASSISVPSLSMPTGTATDCEQADARGFYRATHADRDFLLSGFAAAGATPWREGEPDPRAQLADFGMACVRDQDCKSNVCVPDGKGAEFCSHGCLATPCSASYQCVSVGDRKRCVPNTSSPADEGTTATARSSGCSTVVAGTANENGIAFIAALAIVALTRWRRSLARSAQRR